MNIIEVHMKLFDRQNIVLHATYPECFVIEPFLIGNGDCNDYSPYNYI